MGGGWVGGGWVRNTENKAQLRPALAGALPKLGNKAKAQHRWGWNFAELGNISK